MSSALAGLYERSGRSPPAALADWEGRVDGWCDAYLRVFPDAELSEINLDLAVFQFDRVSERVTLAMRCRSSRSCVATAAHARLSRRQCLGAPRPRGSSLRRGQGHFLGHASGGILDINLFPQRRELNRGWSEEGKRFRSMERYVAEHPGTFFCHRPSYRDQTWIPATLEYGVLVDGERWWVDRFRNVERCPGMQAPR